MTLGSLFDGVGTWQLAARNNGIQPLWSSEIDSFCLQVSRRHFPDTFQLGDITQIADAPHVDIITAGSPCQNLSIAGRREGINGEKSALFFHATKLIRRIRPKFFIWENVTGVLSSNGGADFRAVLEEILQEPVPLPKHFSNAGLADGRHCQLSWRILDSQFFGIPQRRKRIFLIADFTGRRAAKILFEPESQSEFSSRYSKAQRQRSAATAFGIGRDAFNKSTNAKFKPTFAVDLQPALTARGAGAVCTGGIIRRLTPLECERLQGLPDDWTQGGSNSQRYKALGNGMALPVAVWLLKRLKEVSS